MFDREIPHLDWNYTPPEEKKEPIVNGEAFFINCSNCGAPLVQIWVTGPEAKVKTKMVAMCPHCGDKSYIKEIMGSFYIGFCKYTVMIDSDYEYGKDGEYITQQVVIKTAKGDVKYE